MTNEPFGRQPKPVTVRIDGSDDRDIHYWAKLFRRGAEQKGDSVSVLSGVTDKFCEFTIYPRAVND